MSSLGSAVRIFLFYQVVVNTDPNVQADPKENSAIFSLRINRGPTKISEELIQTRAHTLLCLFTPSD